MPAWVAVIEQVPAATSVTVAPFVPPEVHTAGVVAENVTGRPDVAVAATVTGDCSIVLLDGPANEIVWCLARP